MMKKCTLLLLSLGLFISIASTDYAEEKKKDFYLFYSITCSSCTKARHFIREIEKKYPQISFHELEVVKTRKNQELFMELNEHLHITVPGVPIFIFGNDYIVGFKDNELSRMKVIGLIERELALQNPRVWRTDTGNRIINRIVTKPGELPAQNGEIFVPVAGRINPHSVSLPTFTLILGLVDGVNPCAIWVLMFLLTLLVNTRNRKKLLLVGLVFVATSGTVYLLFMVAWLNIFQVFGIRQRVTVVFAAAVIGIGLINLKEIFFFKRGVSLMIPEKARPKILTKARDIMANPSILLSISGTVSLAFFVNLIEFGCTVGIPAVYAKVLSFQEITTPVKYGYILLYNIAYTIPLLAIVLLFGITFGKYRIQERHGKVLKGVSGALLLLLGILLLVNPGILRFG